MDVVGHAADAKGDGAQLLALRGDQVLVALPEALPRQRLAVKRALRVKRAAEGGAEGELWSRSDRQVGDLEISTAPPRARC
jgi:hypothetical protein